jgi:ribA/ribD-fused uncharacterized protein
MNAIYFYSHNRGSPHSALSNFYHHVFDFDGKEFTTAEHAFQRAKFAGVSARHDEYAEIIRTASTASKAKMLGTQNPGRFGATTRVNLRTDSRTIGEVIRSYSDLTPRPDWGDYRFEVMELILRAKFEDPDLHKLLAGTAPAPLVEDSPTDYVWGCGKNKTGDNRLGKMLVKIRDV